MNAKEKVLVTGATGFIGSYLVRYLLSKGYELRCLKREKSKLDLVADFYDQVDWVETELTDVIGLQKAFEQITHVCHCAALPSFHPKDKRNMFESNVQATANVVNLCLENNIEKLIHVSSIAAIGRTPTRLKVDETCEWVESKDNSTYGITKHLAEMEVWRGIAEGLNAVIVSPSVVVGSKTWDDGMAGFFKKIDNGLKFCPSGQSGFVDVRDVVLFMEMMLKSEITGERYILNSVNLKHQDFFRLIAKSLDVKEPTIVVGPILSEVAWRVEWLKEKLLGMLPMVTKESARASVTHYYYSNKKSLTVPGFNYRSIEATIKEMAAQYKEAKANGFSSRYLPL
ncbi:MAG: NAD-dependent epimerase/dehydratase family protein [Saprospiraceae bacterium]|nr:NAD-dependent epimerase/dehydratase family protein [Saprospiraceae bacterium]